MSSKHYEEDDFARLAFADIPAQHAQAVRYDTEVMVVEEKCQAEGCSSKKWDLKTTVGEASNKRKLPEPIMVCNRCGREWKWEIRSVARSVEKKRWSTAKPWHSDLQMARVVDLALLHAAARRMERSDTHRWKARVYFSYVVQFEGWRANGGYRALVAWAHNQWPRAPFTWNEYQVRKLIDEGREAWRRRLVRGGWLTEEVA